MNNAQLKEILEQFKQIQYTIEQLENFKIDWEIDLKKMNFSLLRSTPDCDIEKSYIEKLDLTKTHHWDCWQECDIANMLKDKATQNLVKFISDGNKIIPPLYAKELMYDGETYSIKEDTELKQRDGGHRLFLSAIIRLEEIPIIVYEKIVKYSFPMDKWDFECLGEILVFKSKDRDDILEFDVNKIWINDVLFHKNIVTIESY